MPQQLLTVALRQHQLFVVLITISGECLMNQSSKTIEIEGVEFRVAELERATETKSKA
jgi:hypothetical protein